MIKHFVEIFRPVHTSEFVLQGWTTSHCPKSMSLRVINLSNLLLEKSIARVPINTDIGLGLAIFMQKNLLKTFVAENNSKLNQEAPLILVCAGTQLCEAKNKAYPYIKYCWESGKIEYGIKGYRDKLVSENFFYLGYKDFAVKKSIN